MSKETKALAKVILPLKRGEERAAIRAAKAGVAKELSDHYRILGAQLRIEKPSDPRNVPLRMIGVLIVDYGSRRNLEVVVNARGEAVQVIDLRGVQPAFTREEIDEAVAIARRDDRVARIAKMRGVFVSEFGPERAADYSRRIGLRYTRLVKGRESDLVAHAIVDLSARAVVQFEEAASR